MIVDMGCHFIPFLMEPLRIRILLPHGYESGEKRYPVLYVNDGQSIFASEALRYDRYERTFWNYLPQVILVAIDAPVSASVRTALYSPYTMNFDVPEGKCFENHIVGKGKEYLNWLLKELKPEIDRKFRTLSQAEATGICGYSTGGLFALYAGLVSKEGFSRILMMSPAVAIWRPCLEQTLSQADTSHLRYIYLDVGTNEFGRMTTKEEFLQGGERLKDYFQEQGFDEKRFYFEVHPGVTHHVTEWKNRFPDSIRWAFQDFFEKTL